MNLTEIGYLTGEPSGAYAKAIDGALRLDDLRLALKPWRSLAEEAYQAVLLWSEADFVEFRRILKIERRGRDSGREAQERFASVILPDPLFTVSVCAQQFKVPWGLAYIRLRDTGRLVERDGIASIVPKPR